MIKHRLSVIGAGHDPRPEQDDFEVLHITYKLETIDFDPESNTILQRASSGLKVLELAPWNLENKIPGQDVTKEILKQWVTESVDLENLKELNIANLKPVT